MKYMLRDQVSQPEDEPWDMYIVTVFLG